MINRLTKQLQGIGRRRAGSTLLPVLLGLVGGAASGLVTQWAGVCLLDSRAGRPLALLAGAALTGTAQSGRRAHGPGDRALVDTTLADTTLADTTLADTTLADTTLLVGRQNFTGYTTPLMCLGAVRAVETLAHRSATDSISYTYYPEDTLSTAAVAVARRCGSRFTVEGVPPAELLDLAQLALAVKDDAKARAAAERYAAVAPTPEARRWAFFAADTLFLHAKPRRWALVDAMTARLDSVGPLALLQRKLAHDELYGDAKARYDVARLRREALALFAICPQLSTTDRAGSTCSPGSLALDLFAIELYQSPGDVSSALERTGRLVTAAGFTDWDHFRQMLVRTEGKGKESFVGQALAQIGTQAPPLVAQHWVGPKGRAPGWPVKGKASIFLRGRRETDQPEHMAVWKRLGTKYKDQLDITILVPTQGYFRTEPPLSPTAEATRLGQYYRDQLGVPATVAVVETPVTQLPPPDRRFILGEPPLENDPYYGRDAFLLTDRTGQVLLAGFLGRLGNDAMLDAWIARALGR